MTGLNATRFAKCGAAAAAAMAMVGGANAATITWGSAGSITSAGDISNAGTAFMAESFGGGNPTVNGVNFDTDSGGYFNAGLWSTATGDAGLDAILDSHGHATGPGPYSVTVTGLSVGVLYQIQLIAVHDVRGCCSGRISTVDDGAGNFTGPSFTRGQGGTVIGTFTADSTSQTVQLLGDSGANPDPGLSGYVVRTVPEPGSLALLGLGGLALLRRRR